MKTFAYNRCKLWNNLPPSVKDQNNLMKFKHAVKEFMYTDFQYVANMRLYENKRAQRALGRSPEEKVKGNSGANYRETQGHNLNNFGRGPFDDVIY